MSAHPPIPTHEFEDANKADLEVRVAADRSRSGDVGLNADLHPGRSENEDELMHRQRPPEGSSPPNFAFPRPQFGTADRHVGTGASNAQRSGTRRLFAFECRR